MLSHKPDDDVTQMAQAAENQKWSDGCTRCARKPSTGRRAKRLLSWIGRHAATTLITVAVTAALAQSEHVLQALADLF